MGSSTTEPKTFKKAKMQNKRKASPVRKRSPTFPLRLYEMLENAEQCGYDHIISWMPDGKSFKVHADSNWIQAQDEYQQRLGERAVLKVLQKNGFNQKRYKSFLRQLQLYGFQRTFIGPRQGERKHPFLIRGRPDLLEQKSVENFQHKGDSVYGCIFGEELVRAKAASPAPTVDNFEMESEWEPAELFLKKDDYNYWKPALSPFLEGVL